MRCTCRILGEPALRCSNCEPLGIPARCARRLIESRQTRQDGAYVALQPRTRHASPLQQWAFIVRNGLYELITVVLVRGTLNELVPSHFHPEGVESFYSSGARTRVLLPLGGARALPAVCRERLIEFFERDRGISGARRGTARASVEQRYRGEPVA